MLHEISVARVRPRTSASGVAAGGTDRHHGTLAGSGAAPAGREERVDLGEPRQPGHSRAGFASLAEPCDRFGGLAHREQASPEPVPIPYGLAAPAQRVMSMPARCSYSRRAATIAIRLAEPDPLRPRNRRPRERRRRPGSISATCPAPVRPRAPDEPEQGPDRAGTPRPSLPGCRWSRRPRKGSPPPVRCRWAVSVSPRASQTRARRRFQAAGRQPGGVPLALEVSELEPPPVAVHMGEARIDKVPIRERDEVGIPKLPGHACSGAP